MAEYLGKITHVNQDVGTFVNFKPQYRFWGGTFLPLTPEEISTLLPESQKCDINFYAPRGANFRVEDQFLDDELCIFSFDSIDDLEDSINVRTEKRNQTGYKVDVSSLPGKKIKHLEDYSLYYVVHADRVGGDYQKDPVLIVNDANVFAGKKVVIQIDGDNSAVLGPFEIEWRTQDDRHIVITGSRDTKIVPTQKYYNGDYFQHLITLCDQEYLKVNSEICKQVYVDTIESDELLLDFKKSLDANIYSEGKLDISNVDRLIQLYSDALVGGKRFPDYIRTQRLEKLKKFLSDESELDQTFKHIADIVASLLLKYPNDFSEIVEKLADNSEFMSKIQRVDIIGRRIKEKESEIDDCEQKIKALKDDIQQLENQREDTRRLQSEALSSEYEEAIKEKKAEKDKLEAEISELLSQLANVEDANQLQAELNKLNEEIGYKEKYEHDLDAKIGKLKKQLDDIFDAETEKAVSFAFDGMLSNRMLAQAAEWEASQKGIDYVAAIATLQKTAAVEMPPHDLVDYLCQKVQSYRSGYDRNTILNIFICLTQGFLTVFSGAPGTGKTTICDIVSNVLGLTLPDSQNAVAQNQLHLNRYIKVPVERGWTSKRDFIGYYNPLTKQFDRSNHLIFDSLNILHSEATGTMSGFPFFILLDEANLSPMEYYWADFISAYDDLYNNPKINLGENFYFNIPSFLRFMATINSDQTTEALSPRVIDRAWVIKLPDAERGLARELRLSNDSIQPISWNSLSHTFGSIDDPQLSGAAKELYDKISDKLNKAGIFVSSRSDGAIRRYWNVAQNLFEDEEEFATDKTIVALDYAIAQRILPQINGAGEKFREHLETLKELCENSHLRMSSNILSDIIIKGEQKMDYYQYFA